MVDAASQPIRNLNRNPKLDLDATGFASGSVTGGATQSAARTADAGPSGRGFAWVKTVTGPSSAGSWSATIDFAGTGGADPSAAGCVPVEPGKRYYFGFWMRTSFDAATVPLIAVWRNAAGTNITTPTIATLGLTAGRYTWCVASAVAPAEAAWVRLSAQSSRQWFTGDTWSVTRVAASDQILSVYCDGDTPGWRWLGTVGASPSVGYPYTLESIAGQPIAAWAGALGMVALGLAFADWTVIGVGLRGAYSNMGGIGIRDVGARNVNFIQGSQTGGNEHEAVGWHPTTGAGNAILRRNNGIPTDANTRFVLANTRSGTSARLRSSMVFDTPATAGVSAPSGLLALEFGAPTTQSRDQWDRVLVYPAMNEATERSAMTWLANAHGAALVA